MAVHTSMRSRAIHRASIGSSYLKRDYTAWSATDKPEDTAAEQLCIAWFRYQAKRTVDGFILSGAHDTPAMAGCLNAIVQHAFHILLARNGAEVAAARGITSTGNIRYVRAWDGNSRGARLGTDRCCQLGSSTILGDAAAEQTARFELTVEMSVFQVHRLRARPDVVDHILNAFESAVPLNMDYRLVLSVRNEDRTFRLVSAAKKPAEPPSGSGRFPLLGITTALGAEKS